MPVVLELETTQLNDPQLDERFVDPPELSHHNMRYAGSFAFANARASAAGSVMGALQA